MTSYAMSWNYDTVLIGTELSNYRFLRSAEWIARWIKFKCTSTTWVQSSAQVPLWSPCRFSRVDSPAEWMSIKVRNSDRSGWKPAHWHKYGENRLLTVRVFGIYSGWRVEKKGSTRVRLSYIDGSVVFIRQEWSRWVVTSGGMATVTARAKMQKKFYIQN